MHNHGSHTEGREARKNALLGEIEPQKLRVDSLAERVREFELGGNSTDEVAIELSVYPRRVVPLEVNPTVVEVKAFPLLRVFLPALETLVRDNLGGIIRIRAINGVPKPPNYLVVGRRVPADLGAPISEHRLLVAGTHSESGRTESDRLPHPDRVRYYSPIERGNLRPEISPSNYAVLPKKKPLRARRNSRQCEAGNVGQEAPFQSGVITGPAFPPCTARSNAVLCLRRIAVD